MIWHNTIQYNTIQYNTIQYNIFLICLLFFIGIAPMRAEMIDSFHKKEVFVCDSAQKPACAEGCYLSYLNKLQQQKIHRFKNYILLGGSTLLVFAALLFFNLFLYRKQRRAYFTLYQQIKNETHLPTLHNGTPQERELCRCLHQYLMQDDHFINPNITVKELAAALSTNRSYLYKATHAVTGKTLSDYISLLKLEKAKQKLATDFRLSIEAIATQCGYNHPSTFYRRFKAQYNLTPSEYRKLSMQKKALK